MADNYLEKKYEQYQARKISGTRTSHNTKTLHKTRRVFITGGAEGIGKAIVRTFRGAGHLSGKLRSAVGTEVGKHSACPSRCEV